MIYTLDDYLREIYADSYTGLSDYMSDDFDEWLSDLGVQEILDHAERHIRINYLPR